MNKCKLGDVASVIISNVDKKSYENEIKVKLCNFTDVYYNWAITLRDEPKLMVATATNNEICKYKLHKGDVAITKDSETKEDIGQSTLIADEISDMLLGYHCALIRPNTDKLLGAYLNAVLHTKLATRYFELNASGSGQRYTLSVDAINDFQLYLPSINEQERISKILTDIDRKIENNTCINDNLAQQAKLLYDYWFTQFDFPDENNKPYRSSGGKMEWNDRIKRNIPTGWHVVTFTNIATWESNSQPPKSEFRYEPQDGYVRFIQNRDYDSNAHKTYIPLTKNLSIVDRLDILMDKYGDAGAVRYGIEGAFNVALGKINVHNTSHREYIRSYLESDGIYTYLHNSCMASTRASLSESNLANLILVMPDDVTIAKYEAILNNIRKRILKNNDEIEKLVELRDWFLPLLMNGQATIAE